METVHGTSVAIDGAAVLLRGPSGSGKSDLALRLIDRGAKLVADDRTVLTVLGDGTLSASSPPAIAGRMEVRGVGIVPAQSVEAAPLRLIVDLGAVQAEERMPPKRTISILGVELPVLRLDAFDGSAPAKIRLAMRLSPGEIER